MGTTTQTVGGGAAAPFGEEFINNFLYQILFGPGAGPSVAGKPMPVEGKVFPGGVKYTTSADKQAQSRPFDMTQGIAGQLMKLVGGRDITGEKESLASLIESDIGRGVADIRERFTAGSGGGLGTPGAVGEALFRSEAVPRKALAIGQLETQNIMQQLQAILPLLQLMGGITGMGIPQASVVQKPGLFGEILGPLAGAATGAGSILQGINTGRA
jgi:hypothetical protein